MDGGVMESVPCNLCGSATTEPFTAVVDLLLERLNVKTTLVRCRQCGLVYQNPRPTLAEMGQHYPPEYESYTDQTVQTKRNWLLQKAVQHGTNKRCRFVTKHKPAGKLLDIGCAMGGFLLGMRDQGGWTLSGVEVNQAVAAAARERHGLDVFAGTLEEANFPTAAFDVVTLWDVFEHLHDPYHALTEIHRILRPDGIVVIRVPNLASWDAKLFGPTWAGLDSPRHLYLLTPETLTAFLTKAGFAVVEHSCAIGSYVTFVLSIRFWLTARGVSAKTKALLMKLLYHPVARLLSAPLFYLVSMTRRGPLLVTVARKVEAEKS
ncbi:MAG: class I SAM-dependent methyltransferase [Caldilinea sp. CFX5]|nr:class I SAM-dependent methyltransferase [Caldilinea sp. CFX5]